MNTEIRNNEWLEMKLHYIWERYFSDIKKLNHIQIFYGRNAKRRLASIRQQSRHQKDSDTQIKVTGFYKDSRVPEYVIDATIAHELVHYSHGFASPHPQYYKHPHRGDIVDKELKKRGLGRALSLQKKWLEKNWAGIVTSQRSSTATRQGRRRPQSVNFWAKIAYSFGLIN